MNKTEFIKKEKVSKDIKDLLDSIEKCEAELVEIVGLLGEVYSGLRGLYDGIKRVVEQLKGKK